MTEQNLQENLQEEMRDEMLDVIEDLFDNLDGDNPSGDLLELGWVALPRGLDDSQPTNFRGGLEAISQRRLEAMTGSGLAGGLGDDGSPTLVSEAVPLWVESGELERVSAAVQSLGEAGRDRGGESFSVLGGSRGGLVEQIDRQARNTATA